MNPLYQKNIWNKSSNLQNNLTSYTIPTMNTTLVLDAIDNEIAKLQAARDLLTDTPTRPTMPASNRMVVAIKLPPHKPRAQKPVTKVTAQKVKQPHTISPEGRKRIAEAVKARWAAQKKAAVK